MHRSSKSIAALAAALAKAQSQLSNPEKSLVATIGTDRPGEGARSFRYAPLSSGLDIVRKALGQQQIATVQTTAIDAASGTITLTTVLAHASGEWIASDWPVCRLADTASPHRMGAALTYARRYALFTLVGIAGEDDLDAPDLNGSPPIYGQSRSTVPEPARRGGKDGNAKGVRQPTLGPESSAALRDRLVHEIAGISSAKSGAEWARSALPAKNSLIASDARLVQLAFELRLSTVEGAPKENTLGSALAADAASRATEPSAQSAAVHEPSTAVVEAGVHHSGRASSGGIDKSVLTLSEVRRYRDKNHIRFVASRPCLVCGRKPADPHHLRFAQVRALGRKVSDEFTVPLCRLHHREVHRAPNEPDWWSKLGIDALATALRLWKMTRLPNEAAVAVAAEPTAPAPAGEVGAPEKIRARRRARKRADLARARDDPAPPMTSLKQIEANRRNALQSTGPTSANGKHVSRRNALRHGFTAETVLEPLEDPQEYRTFEAAILSEYLPQTPVEQELVRRLASLFWRLRRATSIETGLLRMQGEILHAFRSSRQKVVEARGESIPGRFGEPVPEPGQEILPGNAADEPAAEDHQGGATSPSRDIALSYLRLANLDNELIDRLSRYEGGLWRQAVQTLFALQALKRR